MTDRQKRSTASALTGREKISYGAGAVGKDMVYMLSAGYVLYYYQDILGINAIAMGIILLAARIFDALNDPVMGMIVANTRTKMGRFRPWLLVGTLTNAAVLFLMFSCPPALDGGGMVAYAAILYVLWGVTYTMMDIPYWSMIPAFTRGGKERENLTTFARSCSGVGSAIVTIFTMAAVHAIGTMAGGSGSRETELLGFRYFSLGVAILFVVCIAFTVLCIHENSTAEMKAVSVREMFGSLIRNDQAMTVVLTIVLINTAMYITSNLLIYFFKYDFGGTGWYNSYTLFNMAAGAAQILAMMALYPFLRRFLSSIRIFYVSMAMAVIGYLILLVFASSGLMMLPLLLIPGVLVMASSGMNNVLVTIFLANTVDYGEVKNHRRDESVIFSMQTFVVKLASGLAVLIASITLAVFHLSNASVSESDQVTDFSLDVPASAQMGLRMVMTLAPIALLIAAFFWFRRKYILTDEKVEKIAKEIDRSAGNPER